MLAIFILSLPVALGGLFFTLFHLARRAQALGRTATTPALAEVGQDVCLVGIAQPDDPPGRSPLSEAPVLWLRASEIARGNRHTHSYDLGKVSTRFLLVDETVPDASVVIESKKISDLHILMHNRRYSKNGAALGNGELADDAMQGILAAVKFHLIERGKEERAVYPGDRIWAHGKLAQHDGKLRLGGFSAWLDDRPPEARVAWSGAHARVGAMGTGAAAVLALFSYLLA